MAGDRAESLLELAPQEKALLDPNWQREHDCSFHVIALTTAWGLRLMLVVSGMPKVTQNQGVIGRMLPLRD
jgi:hypothetical protein